MHRQLNFPHRMNNVSLPLYLAQQQNRKWVQLVEMQLPVCRSTNVATQRDVSPHEVMTPFLNTSIPSNCDVKGYKDERLTPSGFKSYCNNPYYEIQQHHLTKEMQYTSDQQLILQLGGGLEVNCVSNIVSLPHSSLRYTLI